MKHTNKIAIAILTNQYHNYDISPWKYDAEYKILTAMQLKLVKEQSNWLMLHTDLAVEKIMDFESSFNAFPLRRKIPALAHKALFNDFRKVYPGTKRGNETEFTNFSKKHKNWEKILPLLLPAVNNQIQARDIKRKLGGFVPEWKNLQTWINQSCWEEVIALPEQKVDGNRHSNLSHKMEFKKSEEFSSWKVAPPEKGYSPFSELERNNLKK